MAYQSQGPPTTTKAVQECGSGDGETDPNGRDESGLPSGIEDTQSSVSSLPELDLRGPQSLDTGRILTDGGGSTINGPPSNPTNDRPPQYKEHQYDGLLIASPGARHPAKHFKTIVENRVTLKDGSQPKILYFDDMAISWKNRLFERLDEALKRTTFTFFFMTRDFEQDAWTNIQKNEALMELIEVPDKNWSAIPLTTQIKKTFRYPAGTRSLLHLDISMLYLHDRVGHIAQVVEGGEDKPADQLPFLRKVAELFNDRLYLKREREDIQEADFQVWKRAKDFNDRLQREAVENAVRNMNCIQGNMADFNLAAGQAAAPVVAAGPGPVYNIENCQNVQIGAGGHINIQGRGDQPGPADESQMDTEYSVDEVPEDETGDGPVH